MVRKVLSVSIAVLMALAFATIALATGTPPWWDDNNTNYTTWRKVTTTGTASNTGQQSQLVLVTIDVPNTWSSDHYKQVWAQVEWTVTAGTVDLQLSPSILWTKEESQTCPSDPTKPFPSPYGSGTMTDEGTFTPEHGYANGREFSYSNINPQPTCERLEFRFTVYPNSGLDYYVEVQTVCQGPNAVRLSDFNATSGRTRLPTVSLVGIPLVAIGAVGLFALAWHRKDSASQ